MNKLRQISLLILGLTPLSAIAQTVEPSAQFQIFDGSSYTIFRQKGVSWDAAKAYVEDPLNQEAVCGPTGGTPHLATLTRSQEDEFVAMLRAATGLRELWIGGSQQPDMVEDNVPLAESDWFWENGEGAIPGSSDSAILGHRNWLDGEPNDNTGAGSEEHLAIGLQNADAWNDEGNLKNIDGFVAECDFFDNNGLQLLTENPDDPNSNITSVGNASTGEPATATQTSCVICRPMGKPKKKALWYPRRDGAVNLRPIIAETEGCEALNEALPANDRIWLLRGQRGFERPSDGRECFTASLVQLRDLEGEPVDAIDGPVFSEEVSLVQGQPVECAVDLIGQSPFGLGKAVGQSVLTPDTLFCNRRRSATRYSDRFQLFDVRLDPHRVPIRRQVAQYATVFRSRLQGYIAEGCVDRPFLREVRRQYNRAIANSQSWRRNRIERSVDQLQDLAVFALNISEAFDPYREANMIGDRTEAQPLCPGEAKGELASQILAMSHLIHRGRLFPTTFNNYADALAERTDLRCLIAPFPLPPLDTIPEACANPDNVLPPPYLPGTLN